MNAAPDGISNKRSFRWAWLSIYFLAALLVTHVFSHFVGLEHSSRASLQMMVDGVAKRPFAERILIPELIRIGHRATPEILQDTAWQIVSHTGLHPEFLVWNFDEFLFDILSVICFFLAAIYGRRAYAIAYRAPPIESSVAALLYVLCVPLWFRYFNYIYDPGTICLCTLMAYAILAKRPWMFALVFCLAIVNKETAILALPVWAVATWMSGNRKGAAGGTVLLGALWLLIRFAILKSTAHLGGEDIEWHLIDHQAILLQNNFGSALYSGLVMFVELALAFWVVRNKPRVLVAGFVCTFIPLFLLSIPFGFVDELRALYDSYPYVLLLALPTLLEMLAIRPTTNLATAAPG